MPIILLGSRTRQFKQLTILELCRRKRFRDPLSHHLLEDHRRALEMVTQILKQGWSFLLLQRRFLQDTRSFTDHLTKTQVVDQLLAALEAYEKCLSHQAEDPQHVSYDLAEFERNLGAAISTLHSIGQTMRREIVERPKMSWKCTKEYDGWKANRRDLVNPSKGKIRVREWDFPVIGQLMNGKFTITFQGYDENIVERLLVDTLPAHLVNLFGSAPKPADNLKLKTQPQVLEDMPAVSPVVPQGRMEFPFRPKGARGKSGNKSRANKTDDAPCVPKSAASGTRKSSRLVLRSKQEQVDQG